MATPINVEDELFWQKVREGYDQLVNGATSLNRVVVQLAHREATIENAADFTFVYIREVDPPIQVLQAE